MAQNGLRLKAAETVALKLGGLLEDLYDDLRSLPRWRPAFRQRGRMEGSIEVGLVLFHAWREAFAVE